MSSKPVRRMNIFDRMYLSFDLWCNIFHGTQHAISCEARGDDIDSDSTESNDIAPKTEIVEESANSVPEKVETVEAKTEQQINAEAECPVELVDAQKDKKPALVVVKPQDTVVEGNADAAMSGSVSVTEQAQKVMDFDEALDVISDAMFGDSKKSENLFNNKPVEEKPAMPMQDFSGFNTMEQMMEMQRQQNAAAVIAQRQGTYVSPFQQIIPQQPFVQPQVIPQQPFVQPQVIPQQPFVQPQVIPQQQIPMYPTFTFWNPPAPAPMLEPQHKVDEAPKPVKKKAKKNEPDKVDMEGVPNIADGLEISNNKPIDARKIGVVTDKVDMTVEQETVAVPVNRYADNNAEYIKNYPFLAEIEKYAIENGYLIAFGSHLTGLIDCYVCDKDTAQPINGKGFTIDTGYIINGAKKIYPTIATRYEDYNPYFLFTRNKDSNGKAVMNFNDLHNLIVGGNEAITGKPMFTVDFLNANKLCALITIPVKKLNKTSRNNIQSKIVELYKTGVLENALQSCPNSRFRVADYSTNGTLILDTNRVPLYYGGPYDDKAERIQLKVPFNGKPKILKGENILPVSDSDQKDE